MTSEHDQDAGHYHMIFFNLAHFDPRSQGRMKHLQCLAVFRTNRVLSCYVHVDTSTSPSPGFRLRVVRHLYKHITQRVSIGYLQ